MAEVRLRPQAKTDLKNIWKFSYKRWGLHKADDYLQSLQQAFEILDNNPGIGRSLEHIRPGYRKYHVRSHFLIYLTTHGRIDVVRILHQRMDVESNLF